MRAYAVDRQFGARLEQWFASTREQFADRTLPVTTAIAIRWSELCIELRRRDINLLIAATALENDLTVATRNVRHFEKTGVRIVNPYGV